MDGRQDSLEFLMEKRGRGQTVVPVLLIEQPLLHANLGDLSLKEGNSAPAASAAQRVECLPGSAKEDVTVTDPPRGPAIKQGVSQEVRKKAIGYPVAHESARKTDSPILRPRHVSIHHQQPARHTILEKAAHHLGGDITAASPPIRAPIE